MDRAMTVTSADAREQEAVAGTPPLYQRIHDEIEQRIRSGQWPPGYRIPSEKDLAAEYGCARMTVNKALSQLVHEGYITRRKRAGSVVTRPRALSAVLEIHDIATEVRSLGREYSYRLLEQGKHTVNDDVARRFDPGGGARVLAVTALHLAGGQPFCFEERWINLDSVPEASEAPFAEEAPGAWLLRRVPWNQAEHEISARGASAPAAAALGVSDGAPCLVIERRTWNDASVVTFVRLTYPGETHTLVARFGPRDRAT
jgi:GntR family histidine utilization transcriptional repressor